MSFLKRSFLLLLAFSIQGGTLLNKTGDETNENFMINSAKSISERAGQIFAIPQKFNIIMGDYSIDGISHIKINGKIEKITTPGTGHGTPWNYDTHIPLIMYGSGFVNANKKVDRFVTQQDIPITYANILGVKKDLLPDAQGSILKEAFKNNKKPKVIMTIVLDQVGMNYFNRYKDELPELNNIIKNGTLFTNAKVTHLESETAVGHVAIGTGAFPKEHGIPSNSFYMKNEEGNYKEIYSFQKNRKASPEWLNSLSLADVYDVEKENKPIIIGYGYAERTSMGMSGHGALHKGGDKDIVLYYDDRKDVIATNQDFYTLPEYLKEYKARPYFDRFTEKTGMWMEHKIPFNEEYYKPLSKKTRTENRVMLTPVFPMYEGDILTKLIENEPLGEDEITDLMYITFKSTDNVSHSFGHESEETKEVIKSVDEQVGRVIRALEKKVGKDNILVTITADHGSTPLTELSGGTRINSDEFRDELNSMYDKNRNEKPLFVDIGQVQITIDEEEAKSNGYELKDLKKILLDYKVKGKAFFKYVYTKDDLEHFITDKK